MLSFCIFLTDIYFQSYAGSSEECIDDINDDDDINNNKGEKMRHKI